MKKRFFLVDVMAMAFRTYHALSRRPLSRNDGLPTSALYGSALFLFNLLEKEKPDFLAMVSDSPGKTFRHDLYEAYKANRGDMPEDLAAQIPHLFGLFHAMGFPVVKEDGMEADDIIGTLAKEHSSEHIHSFIVSGDKDFMQLIDDNVSLYSPGKRGVVKLVDKHGVFEKFGCTPEQVIDVLGLMGDSSDNVPGVAGIGAKGASALVAKFGSIDGIYANLEQITNKRQLNGLQDNEEMAHLSKQLVTIKTDCDVEEDLQDFSCNWLSAVGNQRLLEWMESMEFETLAERVRNYMDQEQNPETSKDSETEVASAQAKLSKDYTTVSDAKELEKVRDLLADTPVFAFDTETTGLDIIKDRPIGVAFSVKNDQGWYVPLIEEHAEESFCEAAIPILKDIFANETTSKVAHNLKFDMQMLLNLDIEIRGELHDTMIQSFVLEADSRSHSLDECSKNHLRVHKTPTSDLIGPKGETPMSAVDIKTLSNYACEDTDCCLQLHNLFQEKIVDSPLANVYENVEVPLIPVLARMERHGVLIDPDVLLKISEHLDESGKRLQSEIFELAGEELNINSPKQLQKILFEKLAIHEKLGIKNIKKTKSGLSTDVSVLERLSEHPLPRKILDYRTVSKLKSTYVDTLPQLIKQETGRIHSSFLQIGAATGRLSSSNPNLQNIPIRSEEGKKIRSAFVPPKGWKLLSADYSQIELRLLAHLSGDDALKEAFLSGEDIHTSTAATMFKKPLSEVDSNDRSRAKAINYGLIYGMGPSRLARETKVSTKEAKTFIEAYFSGFPKIRDYIDLAIESAREKGFSVTITGRQRPIAGLDESGGLAASMAQNMSVNSPIQGSAADLIKLAMIKIQKRLDEAGSQARMLMQVHDELVFECPPEEIDQLRAWVKEDMESALKVDVPLEVDIGTGAHWLAAH